jgi:hypothetical protein
MDDVLQHLPSLEDDGGRERTVALCQAKQLLHCSLQRLWVAEK